MRAALIENYGSAHEFAIGECPRPDIGEDDVLVRVHATSVNPLDWKIRSGQLKLLTGKRPPRILGQDFAGVVAETGARVGDVKPGDRVYGMTDPLKGGCYAQYVKVKSKHLALMPDALSFTDATAIPLAALTAWQGLRLAANLRSGSRVLINGASGAVGLNALQISRSMGYQVTAVCSGRNADLVRSMGAVEVINYQKEDVLSRVSGMDAIFDCAGNLPPTRVLGALEPDGSFVTTEPLPALMILSPLLNLIRKRKVYVIGVTPNRVDLQRISELIAGGKLRPVVEAIYPLSDIAAAHLRSESRRAVGKLVIEIDDAASIAPVK